MQQAALSLYYCALQMSKGGLPLSMSKGFFGFSSFSLWHGPADNFTARDPWTWRWKEETSVIPYATKLDTVAEPKTGQHVGPAHSSLSYTYGITVVSSLQRQVHGSLQWNCPRSKIKIRNPQNSPGHKQGKPCLGHSQRTVAWILVNAKTSHFCSAVDE